MSIKKAPAIAGAVPIFLAERLLAVDAKLKACRGDSPR